MKRILLFALTFCMILSMAVVLPAAAENTRLSTDKTVYTVGEPINVTAIGEGKDWVGLYRADDTYDPDAGGVTSIYWYYVAGDGNASGDTKNIYAAEYNNFASRPEFEAGVPAGDYQIALLANDGYTLIERVDITIVEAETDAPPAAPAAPAATFERSTTEAGRADGRLSITHGGTAPDGYVVRWGRDGLLLEGYTDVATVACTGTETVYSMTPNTLIPAGADSLLVYAKVGTKLSDPIEVALPEDAVAYDFGALLGEVQVMSDIHINASDSHIHNRHFAAALADIQAVSPDSLGIFINGDIADHGLALEYEAYNRLLAAAGTLPPVYAAIGNHDLSGGAAYETMLAAFLAGTGNDSETVYFEREIGGYRFIFLGSEAAGLNAELSRAQLDWLDETLDKDSGGKPVFLFLHQGVMDTVAGTFEYQGWHGVNQTAQLKRILKDHPEVILFSGHSHWEMESAQSFKPADENFPTVLNTASAAYLWDDGCMSTNIGIEGSQGYYISIYEDAVVFRGRDFANGLWISSAQFVMAWDGTDEDAPVETDPETTPESNPETDTETNPETTPDTDPETNPETDTETLPVPGTGTETDTDTAAETDAATETQVPDASGCGSAVGMAFPAVLAILGGAYLALRRRKD